MLDFLVDLFYKLLDTLANLGDAFQLLLVPAFLYLFIIRPIHKHWKSHSLQVQHQRRSPNTAQIQEIGFTPVPERNDELEVLCHKAGVSPTGLRHSTGHFTIS